MNRKHEYTIPNISQHGFSPDEYVAVCWGVACERPYDGSDGYESIINGANLIHRANHCGTVTNQYIVEDGSGISMIELNAENLPAELSCTFYTDGTYSTPTTLTDVNVGDTVYWTTSNEDGSWVWAHYGTVAAANSSNIS